jgi:hypothetical protein
MRIGAKKRCKIDAKNFQVKSFFSADLSLKLQLHFYAHRRKQRCKIDARMFPVKSFFSADLSLYVTLFTLKF